MNPLLVTYNPQYNTKVGIRNLSRLIAKLDCDHLLKTVGPDTAKRITKILIGLILIISNIGCDQITKKEVRENISPNERIEVIGDNFILTKVENTGAALGFGSDFHPNIKLFIFHQLLTNSYNL